MKPILFNTEMVRAIQAGRKTVTRRVVKLPSHIQPQDNGLYTLYADGTCYENERLVNILQYLKAPYQVGDILYVRETWRWLPCFECGRDLWAVPCKEGKFNHKYGNTGCYVFKADIHNCDVDNLKWKPSIHMPKEAARLFLRVTGVRLERLQDMDKMDAVKEGIDTRLCVDLTHALTKFKELWNSTLKKDQFNTYSWYANPYVWVIEFEDISEDIKNGRV